MKKNFIRTLTGLLLLVAVGTPLTVFATAYMPFFHRQDKGETVMKAGQAVHLFHSGTDDVRRIIHANDILTVYRITPSCEVKEVGKIRVTSFVGETYIKGEVSAGEIKPDDIAKKGKASCLVISAGVCEQ